MINVAAALLLLLVNSGDEQAKASENTYVRVDVTTSQEIFKAGESGTLIARFWPLKGIHINADPPLEFALGSTDVLRLVGKPQQPLDKEREYLTTTVPVRQGFKVNSEATTGEHLIKGTLTYYFCSDDEGWCRKFVHPLRIRISIAG